MLCVLGKWIVTPQFVLNSVKHKAWLPEAQYELDLSAHTMANVAANPLRIWRESIARGVTSGAFQVSSVVLHNLPTRREAGEVQLFQVSQNVTSFSLPSL